MPFTLYVYTNRYNFDRRNAARHRRIRVQHDTVQSELPSFATSVFGVPKFDGAGFRRRYQERVQWRHRERTPGNR